MTTLTATIWTGSRGVRLLTFLTGVVVVSCCQVSAALSYCERAVIEGDGVEDSRSFTHTIYIRHLKPPPVATLPSQYKRSC